MGKICQGFVAMVIGKLVSFLPGVEFGRLHYRNFEREKYMPYQQIKGITTLLCNYLLLPKKK